MKVLHVITSLSRSAGGPARSVQGLVAAECAAGVDAWVWAINGGAPWVEGVRLFDCSDCSIVRLKQFDLIHIHGIWSWKLHRVAEMCRKVGVPYVIAPRGMLEPWSLQQKWLKKRIARFLYQDRDLKKAAALHATAESEAEQFRKLGFKNYCIVSANGVNVPAGTFKVKERGEGEQRRALFVSRMHPKKGVMELVESWARVFRAIGKVKDEKVWMCELVYTMNSDEERAYEQKVKQRVHELGLDDQFVFTGALDDEKKWEAYGRADLFVLPTYSENFGIVVAEALWAGVPVITTKGTPWSDLVSHNCGWWMDLPAGDGCARWDALDKALCSVGELSAEELRVVGRRGHELVEAKYTWKAVVGAMKHGYEQILNTCELAPCDLCRNYGDTCPMR